MFFFQQNKSPQQAPEPRTHAITEHENASQNAIQAAFGSPPPTHAAQMDPADNFSMVEPHRPGMLNEHIPARRPHHGRSDMRDPRRDHMIPPGHTLEEHHIWENCPHGRVRLHEESPTQPCGEIANLESAVNPVAPPANTVG